jgi:hypothetical protein
MYLFGQGQAFSKYCERRILVNRDVPVAVNRMALGLALLCWAFFLQLVQLVFG